MPAGASPFQKPVFLGAFDEGSQSGQVGPTSRRWRSDDGDTASSGSCFAGAAALPLSGSADAGSLGDLQALYGHLPVYSLIAYDQSGRVLARFRHD